ncbi:MAG TPA: cutinase family protein [Marmoricola sp.]|nr:cutinase family protein [Marmoricola sp.]
MSKSVVVRTAAALLCLLLLPLGTSVLLSSSAVGSSGAITKLAPNKAKQAQKQKARKLQKQRKWCRTHAGKWARNHPGRYAKRCSVPPVRPVKPSATVATPSPKPSPVTPTPTPTPSPTPTPTPNPGANHCGSITGSQTWSANEVHRLTCSVTIQAGASLTIAANAIIKANAGTALTVLGTLRTNGSWSKTAAPTNPVTFTSVNDNTIGGATGTGTPGNSDWTGIITNSAGAVAQLDGVVIRHAAIALDARQGDDLRIRGVLRNDAMGVKGNDDWVDARWVDWGDVTYGPSASPSNAGIKRSGASVTVVPWIGMATPPVPTGIPPQPAPYNQTCTDVVIYGLRYSGAQPQATYPNEPYYANDLDGADGPAGVIKEVFDGMSGGAVTTKIVAIRYPALPVPELEPSVSYANFFTSFYIGGLRLLSAMQGEAARCPNAKFVATGYSQGAAAIRMGLGTLDSNDPLIAKVGGLLLLGDPGKPANASDRIFTGPQPGTENGLVVATPTVKQRTGYFAEAFPEHYHDLPGVLPSRTWNLCHTTDFVCAAGPGTKFSGHAAWYPVYTTDEISRAAWQIGVAMTNGYPWY